MSVINKVVVDHAPILININLAESRKNTNVEKTIKNYKLINYEALKSILMIIPWENIGNMTDVDEMTSFYTTNITNLIEAHTPIHKINLGKNKINKFLPKSAKKMIKRRDIIKT